ncbi:MAG: MFS transporter [Methylotenera sp. 24-45-7]|nr:MAG: MFS transporter [Methylotenera sp. 24-45-7]OZA09963.1 MAG: MFS transporter [Methylotenera sp. 17-45-7]OZA54338.1 MAG: MFS transporter [Methylophilales bacterium 39-45-7]HQS37104.1 MFS transporter [Methylotenera sp.]HQS43145.1 MFS transporter [Methylotenera sp.]
MSKQFKLMQEIRFRPFFMTQFLGAFNDNLFKTALITLVAFHAASLTAMDSAMLVTVLPGVFILPYFLFSATAGQLADKFEKSRIIRIVKICEIGIMLFASAGFFLHNIWLLTAALFMMGMHSTLFGPVKYAYLPQHLTEHELVGGNGMVEMGTFVAILLGQVLGAWLAIQHPHELITSIAILAIAVLGYWHSRNVPDSPAQEPLLKINWNPITETYRSIQFIWHHQVVWLAIIAISWFWFYGATLLAQFPNFAKHILHGDESVFILMLTTFSLGIGAGSLLCEKLSRGKVELGLVMFGGIGISLFSIDLYFASIHLHQYWAQQEVISYLSFLKPHLDMHGVALYSHWRLVADIMLIGLFGGFYIVPLYAFVQSRAEKSHQSRVIAATNILNALFMVVSAGFSIWIFKQGLSIPELFLSTALLNIVVMMYLCLRQPAYYKTFLHWISGKP